MTIEAVIKEIQQAQRITDKFTARNIIIDTGEKYGNLVPVQFGNDRMDQIHDHYLNKKCRIHFALRGAEKNGRYFVNLDGFRIECLESVDFNNPSQPPAPQANSGNAYTQPSSFDNLDGLDDLPF